MGLPRRSAYETRAAHVDDRRFEKLVTEAIRGLPPKFKNALDNIEIVIEDYAPDEVLDEMGIDPPLFGLYQGIPLPDRRLDDSGSLPDKIAIYRDELLDCFEEEELVEEIRITVLHEVGHYFGLDDEEMEELGY
jgi:predicted Zn-dependent protease with MMP-like domain